MWELYKCRSYLNFKRLCKIYLITTLKPLTLWIITNCGKLKEMGIPDHVTCFLRNQFVGQEATVRTYIEQMTGSKLRKKFDKAVYCHPVYLASMHSTSCEMPGWMSYKLKSRLPGEISTTSDMQMIPLSGRKQKGTKEPLDEGQRE